MDEFKNSKTIKIAAVLIKLVKLNKIVANFMDNKFL
jgi:hypothetical protein